MSIGQADFDVNDFTSREAADKSVYVKFYVRPKEDEVESAKEGRPIYKDVEYVEIRTPGNATNVIQRPVSDMDRQRFAPAYRAFKAGETEQLVGLPLTEVPWITRSQVEELSYLRIRTLEQLANIGDDVCTRIPGLFKLKQRAQLMAEKAEHDAPFIKLQEQHDELKNQYESLQHTVKEQAARIEQLLSYQAEKKGK